MRDRITKRASQRAWGFEVATRPLNGPSLLELLAISLIVIGVTLGAALLR